MNFVFEGKTVLLGARFLGKSRREAFAHAPFRLVALVSRLGAVR